MVRGLLEQTLERLEQIDEARVQAIRDLLQPLVQKEFDKVRKSKPHWTKIVFGNGTFAIIGMEDREDPWKYTGARHSLQARGYVAEYAWSGPKYLKNLWYLCEWGAEVCLDDVVSK